jgi:aspartate/methionine/tyrosine aminotransferase
MDAFIVMDTLARANEMEVQGKTVYRFEAGQPTFNTPQAVLDCAREMVDSTQMTYTTPMGLPALRQRIAQYYADNYNVDVDYRDIVITPGSSGAFSLAFLSCFEAGDRVAMAMPCYPSYKRILESFGVEIVPLMATQADKYQPTPALLDEALKHHDIDGLIVASPNNPTGTMLTGDEFEALVTYCGEKNIRVISDELYHGVEFADEKMPTALQFNSDSMVINSFSKYFCMTGWRLGWIVVPRSMRTVINNLQSNLFICASALSQHCAIKAFDCTALLDEQVTRYKDNRDIFVRMLSDMGIVDFAYPQGGFYIYADISHLTDDSTAWANDLLENAGVAVSAGMDFDPYRGHQTIRFSYVCDQQHAIDGLNALKQYIDSQKK